MHWLAKYLSWFFWLVVEGLHSGYWSFHRGHVSKIEYILETFFLKEKHLICTVYSFQLVSCLLPMAIQYPMAKIVYTKKEKPILIFTKKSGSNLYPWAQTSTLRFMRTLRPSLVALAQSSQSLLSNTLGGQDCIKSHETEVGKGHHHLMTYLYIKKNNIIT